jgi:hypothetical protein
MKKKRLLTDRSNDPVGQEQILAEHAEALAREIDREVVWSLLGWTRVKLSRFQDNNHAVDITHWLHENCKSAYQRDGREFIFEDKKDAVLFILTWVE